MKRSSPVLATVVAFCCAYCGIAAADAPGWLPLRDQNPFVLGAGIPLPPETPDHASGWRLDGYVAEANSQLLATDARTTLVYAAETRESRLAFAYALDDAWSMRVSLGTFWEGGGFLDKPIEQFHRLIGAPHGYRGGRLGVQPPYMRVDQEGRTLFLLDQPHTGVAPLLADVTRAWSPSSRTQFGVSASTSVPLGDAKHLDDTGTASFALSAFGDWRIGDALQAGARIGALHQSGNDLLPSLARHGVPFADVYARMPLWAGWSATLQYDAHGALYRNVPNFLGYAGVFSVGLAHALGARAELSLAISEDVPIEHTQDVVLIAALRVKSD